MILYILNKYFYLLIVFSTILISSYTLSHNNTYTIQIHSENQTINIPTNTITFRDHVTLKYQNINLKADKIIIIHTKEKNDTSEIQVYGNPIIIQYIYNKNCIIKIESLTMHYNKKNDTIILTGNVRITQSKNFIQGEHLTYSIKQNQIKIISNLGHQVITTLAHN